MSNMVAIKVVGEKSKVQEIKDLMLDKNMEEFPLGSIPIKNVQEFVEGKRDDIGKITVGDVPYLSVQANNKAGKFMLSMMQANELEEFPLAPLVKKNVDGFLNDERDNVLMLEIKRERDPNAREKLPGHLD